MKKILKYFLILLGILIPGILIAAFVAVFLVNPDHYKPQIIAAVEKRTGRELIINGPLKLQLYPSIGITLTDAALKNPEKFSLSAENTDFAHIDKARLDIALFPLLKRQVNIHELILEGLTVNLVRNNQGLDNWSDLVINLKSPTTTSDTQNPSTGNNPLNMNIAHIHIQNSQFSLDDKPAQKKYIFKNFNFTTEKIQANHTLNQTSPIKGDFIFNTPDLDTQLNYQGILNFIPEQNTLAINNLIINTTLSGESVPNKKITATIKTSLSTNWQKQNFALNNVIIDFNQSRATGSMNIDFSKGLASRFSLAVNKLNIGDYISDISLKLTNINLAGNFMNNILTFQSLSASLYQGSFKGNITIDKRPKSPVYTLNGALNKIDISAFLSDLKNFKKISGTGDLRVNLTTQGTTGVHLRKNLNGTADINLTKGFIEGLDIEYYINSAQLLSKKQSASNLENKKRTPYDNITAHFDTKNGVLTNNDLRMNANFYNITGQGVINLGQETIDYRLKAIGLRQDGTARDDIPLSVLIDGNLYQPNIKPDINSFVQAIIQNQLKKQLSKQLGKQLGIPLLNQTTPDQNTPEQNPDQKQNLENKINKKLNKLLNKL